MEEPKNLKTEELKNEKTEERKFSLNCIYFYLTEGCNLACRHCWITPKFSTDPCSYPYLPIESFKSVVEQAKPLGLSSVKLTGGEPLFHPQINEILDYLKTQDLRLVVETNGVLCTPELAKKISECKSPFVSVSLDGADSVTHEWVRQVEGSFDKAIQGVKNLTAVGIRPQIILSVMHKTKGHLEKIVRLAEELGAESVKFNLVQPTARGEKMHESGETLSIEELVTLGDWVENTLSRTTKLRIVYSHPPAFKPLGKIFGKEKGDGCGRCGIFGIIGVLGNGKYALCGIGETVPEFIFGHVDKDQLEDIWKNNPVLEAIREGLPTKLEGLCGECVMKTMCLGNCIAQNFYSTKSLWATYWYCDMAKKKGKFPESRIKVVSPTLTQLTTIESSELETLSQRERVS